MKNWRPKDCIALIVVMGALGLLFCGIDTIVGWTLLAVVASYYGIEIKPFLNIGKKTASSTPEEGKTNGGSNGK